MTFAPVENQVAYQRVLPMLLAGAKNAAIRAVCVEEFGWNPSSGTLSTWRKQAGISKERASLHFTPEEKAMIERGNRVLRLIKPKHNNTTRGN